MESQECKKTALPIDISEGKIIILPQVRTRLSFNGEAISQRNNEISRIELHHWEVIEKPAIKNLANSIRDKGLFFPPIFALWDTEGFELYCCLLNQIINPIYPINPRKYKPNFPQDVKDKTHFLVLIAGHRRILAIRDIVALADNTLFPGNKVAGCTIFHQPAGDYAIGVQLEENNTQQPVRQWCELAVAARLYLRQKNQTTGLSQKDFSHRYNISPDTLASALNLLELPEIIQENILANEGDVSKITVPKANVRELYRLMLFLRDKGQEENDIDNLLITLIPKYLMAHNHFRKVVEDIRSEFQGQQVLFSLTHDEVQRGTNSFISSQTAHAAKCAGAILASINYCIKTGVVSPDAPFSTNEARQATLSLYAILLRLNCLLEVYLQKAGDSVPLLTQEVRAFIALMEGNDGKSAK
jgi:hypothetical protein